MNDAPMDSMPTNTSRSINLSPEQQEALFGPDHSCTPGEPITVELVPGDSDESGFRSFDVKNSAPETETDSETPSEAMSRDEDETDLAETKMLGYSRKKLNADRQSRRMGATIKP